MRVFVTGTGRCGTMTFAMACSWMTNFTSGHETHRRGTPQSQVNEFPDNHIEVDAHLFWHMGVLIHRYPEARWVHLRRNREDCVKSLMKTSGIRDWMRLAYTGAGDLRRACEDYYDSTNQIIGAVLETVWRKRFMHLENLPQEWSGFWEWIGAEGDYEVSLAELSVRHNQR